MKPFDLKKALAGEPVVARDGKKIEFLAHDPKAGEGFRILARRDGESCAYFFYTNGKHTNGVEMPCDLFMAPTKREGWVLVYDDLSTSRVYKSKSEAEERLILGYKAKACRIEWEE